ncbi:MAG: BMP family ABC transporter substrate-binding protein [Candidatus Bathyarchaeota archaeon]|jgi:basic membrane protein A|nr:BMP family ABC transporter substrate-binding protein [Candidatus Bathyarchaeota archaeon]
MKSKGISNTIIALAVIIIIGIAAVAVYYFALPQEPAEKKVGLIIATGGLGDKSFNDISYAGVQRAKEELGIDFDFVEPEAIAQYEGFQRDFAKSGDYEIIICVGFDQADALTVVSQEYPDQNFAIVDMVVVQPNVASLLFKSNEASFLVGVAAGMITDTGNVGFVGGMDIDLINDFYLGYEAGVQWVDTEVTVLEPVYVGDWGDPTKGKELAKSLVDLGADGIFIAAGKSGLGALDAVNEEDVTGFGVDACQCYLYVQNIPVSTTKRVDIAVYEMIEAAIEDTFEGGIYNKGLAEGWVGVCRLPDEEGFWEEEFDFTHEPLETGVEEKILEARTKIISGEIIVPTAY